MSDLESISQLTAPKDLLSKIHNDWIFKISSTLIASGDIPLDVIKKSDEIIDLPTPERAGAFKELLQEMTSRTPQSSVVAETDDNLL
jgi:hypothetical protein